MAQGFGTKNKLLTGLALRYNLYDDNTPATVIANEWWLPEFFVQDQWSFNDKQSALGWRTDLHSKHGVINSPDLIISIVSLIKQRLD